MIRRQIYTASFTECEVFWQKSIFKPSSNLPVHPEAYVCLFFRQNGGDSLLQKEENPIPQLFHMALWIGEKNPFRTNFFRQRFSERRKKQTKIHYGTLNFENRKHPRLNVDLETFYIVNLLWYIARNAG